MVGIGQFPSIGVAIEEVKPRIVGVFDDLQFRWRSKGFIAVKVASLPGWSM
jgi:hypothetical protein